MPAPLYRNLHTSDGGIISIAEADLGSRGIPAGGYVQKTVNEAAHTVQVDVSGMSITWTATANRLYAVHASAFLLQGGGVAGNSSLVAMEGAAQLDLANLSLLNGQNERAVIDQILPAVSVGSHTYKLQVATSAGNVVVQGNAAFPAVLYVMDVGPAL